MLKIFGIFLVLFGLIKGSELIGMTHFTKDHIIIAFGLLIWQMENRYVKKDGGII